LNEGDFSFVWRVAVAYGGVAWIRQWVNFGGATASKFKKTDQK
jgi:hypothetical protein